MGKLNEGATGHSEAESYFGSCTLKGQAGKGGSCGQKQGAYVIDPGGGVESQ